MEADRQADRRTDRQIQRMRMKDLREGQSACRNNLLIPRLSLPSSHNILRFTCQDKLSFNRP